MATVSDEQLNLIAGMYLLAAPGGGLIGRFAEISGFKKTIEVIERPEGGLLEPRKVPGKVKVDPITMSSGVILGDNALYDAFLTVGNSVDKRVLAPSNQIYRTYSVISTDRSGIPQIRWRCINMWPSEYSTSDMKADSTELLMEMVTFQMQDFVKENIEDAAQELVNLGIGG